MRADERVIVLGEDVAEGGPYLATAGLAEEFGRERVRNTPISEGAVCGVAIGAAQAGLRPVVEIMYIDFITLALDQLVNQAAKAHFMSGGQLTVPLVLRTQGGAGQRSGAAALAEPRGVADPRAGAEGRDAEQRGRRRRAAARARSPTRTRSCSSRTSRCTSGASRSPSAPEPIPLGRARTVRAGRRRDDRGALADGRRGARGGRAAGRARGVEAEVIDPRTLVPLDLETLARVGAADRARGGRPRGGRRRRVRRRAGRAAAGGGVRLPRGADPARRRAVHAGAGQPAARGRLPPGRGADRAAARVAIEWGQYDVEPWEKGALAGPS